MAEFLPEHGGDGTNFSMEDAIVFIFKLKVKFSRPPPLTFEKLETGRIQLSGV